MADKLRVVFTVEVSLKYPINAAVPSSLMIQTVGQALTRMINKEFQDPKSGLALLVKDVKEATINPVVHQASIPAPAIPLSAQRRLLKLSAQRRLLKKKLRQIYHDYYDGGY